MRVLQLVSLWVCFPFSLRHSKKNQQQLRPGTLWTSLGRSAGDCDHHRHCTGSPEPGSGEPASHSPEIRSGRVLLSLWPLGRPGGTFRGYSWGPRSPPGTTLPTSLSLTPRLSPRVLWERKSEKKAERHRPRGELCWAQALPTPANSLPRGCSALICHFQSLPAHVMEGRGREVGEGLQLREGIYIYVRRQRNRLLRTQRGNEPTEANNSVWDVKSSSAANAASSLFHLPTPPARHPPLPAAPASGGDPTSAMTSLCGQALSFVPQFPTCWKGC